MGKGGVINRLVAGSGGVLAVGGFELDRAKVDQVDLWVLAVADRGFHGVGDFRAGFSGHRHHDENPGGGAAPLAQFVEGGDHGFRFRDSVFAEVDEDDGGAGLELSVGETGAGAGELIDEVADLGVVSATDGPSVSSEGEAGIRVGVMFSE